MQTNLRSAAARQLGVLLILSLLAGGVFLVSGQQITGSLTGIVMDQSQAVIPNAKVTMTNELSGDVRRTETNTQGYLSITGVMPGSYTIRIEAEGFQPYQAEKVAFTSGDRRTLGQVTLQVATTAAEVQVSAVVQELSPIDSGEKSVVLTNELMSKVAVVGRSAAEYVRILPGMAMISSGLENRPGFIGETIGINGNGDAGKQSMVGNVSANGTRPGALDITADGAHVSDPGCNCATPVNPNPEMISEFKVQQSNFSAEFAKGPVVLNSITKAGGRDFHGSGYLSARHFAMNSNDALFKRNNQVEPENFYYFPGGNIGGPVLIPGTSFNKNRDKMFFFVGYEYYRQRIDTGLLRSVVPTAEMKGGDFSNTAYLTALGRATQSVANPIGGDAFPGGRIPQAMLDPGMKALLNLVPAPNRDPLASGGFNWIDALVVDQNMHQFISRVDYSISDYTKLFVRYNRQDEVQRFPIQLWWRNGGAVPLPTPILGKNQSDSISFNLTKVFSPTMTNETVFGYTFVDFPNEYEKYDAVTKSTVGYPYQGIFRQDDKIPSFLSWAGPVSGMWMTGGFDPVLFATKHLFTLSNNVTKVAGTHTMKFGGYWGFIVNKQPGNEPSNGAIYFSPWHNRHTGNLLADMVLGYTDSYGEFTKQVVRDMGWHEFALFAQDSWKVNPRFTLEYGLRAQHMQPWTARNGIGIATWVQEKYNPNAPSSELPGIDWHARDKSVPLAGWATRPLFYAPRVGVAWDLFGTGRTVLRGGYGLFVWHDAQLAAGAMDLPAGLRSTTVGGGPLLSEIDNVSTQGDLVFGGEAVNGSDDRQPTTHSWSFTLSQRLPGSVLWEASYVGNKTRNLIVEGDGLRDINKVPLGAMLNDPGGDANQYRPMRQYQSIRVPSHDSYANYNALQTMVTKQTGNLNLTLAYTWSRAMGIRGEVDTINIDNNYGPLGENRPHILSSSYVFTVPDLVKGGSAVGRQIANGWQISGIWQWNSGVNLQSYAGSNFNMRALIPGENRTIGNADILGTNAISAQPILTCDPRKGLSSGQYINGACFAPPIAGSPGQPGFNGSLIFPYLQGPAFFNADLSLFKSFRVGESKRLEFRGSAYNFMNHPVRSFIGGDENLRLEFNAQGQVVNPRFGYADYQVGKRIVTLGLKFEF